MLHSRSRSSRRETQQAAGSQSHKRDTRHEAEGAGAEQSLATRAEDEAHAGYGIGGTMGQGAWPHAPRADPQQGELAGHRGAREGYREDPCDGEVRVAHPVVVPHDNGGDVSQPPNSGAPSSRRVVRQLALGPAGVLMGAGAPAKVPRRLRGTEFWESTGQTPGESAPQILGYRGLGPRTPNPTG